MVNSVLTVTVRRIETDQRKTLVLSSGGNMIIYVVKRYFKGDPWSDVVFRTYHKTREGAEKVIPEDSDLYIYDIDEIEVEE